MLASSSSEMGVATPARSSAARAADAAAAEEADCMRRMLGQDSASRRIKHNPN
jgi:hypothetical protein